MHGLHIAYGSLIELTFTFHQRKKSENIESLRPRLVNDLITALPFFLGVKKKYYDGSVALYLYYLFLFHL